MNFKENTKKLYLGNTILSDMSFRPKTKIEVKRIDQKRY